MNSSTRVLIEQKSLGRDLRKGGTQSDGSVLNPFEQAKRYVANMPLKDHPRWIVTCNFEEFLIYDMEHPSLEPEHILLSDLGREYYRLQFLVDSGNEHVSKRCACRWRQDASWAASTMRCSRNILPRRGTQVSHLRLPR